MTVAVCLKCGTMKRGAWTPCPKCGHLPETPEDKAKHVMSSDHYFSQEDLEAISQRIRDDEPVQFDPKQVNEVASNLNSTKPGCQGLGVILISVFVISLVVLVGAIFLSSRFIAR